VYVMMHDTVCQLSCEPEQHVTIRHTLA
jgi:hypothetical protein